MFYGWKYEGKNDGVYFIYFWNDGRITDTKFFDTLDDALDFIVKWQEKVEKLEP